MKFDPMNIEKYLTHDAETLGVDLELLCFFVRRFGGADRDRYAYRDLCEAVRRHLDDNFQQLSQLQRVSLTVRLISYVSRATAFEMSVMDSNDGRGRDWAYAQFVREGALQGGATLPFKK